jgi:hypothetical protein
MTPSTPQVRIETDKHGLPLKWSCIMSNLSAVNSHSACMDRTLAGFSSIMVPSQVRQEDKSEVNQPQLQLLIRLDSHDIVGTLWQRCSS